MCNFDHPSMIILNFICLTLKSLPSSSTHFLSQSSSLPRNQSYIESEACNRIPCHLSLAQIHRVRTPRTLATESEVPLTFPLVSRSSEPLDSLILLPCLHCIHHVCHMLINAFNDLEFQHFHYSFPLSTHCCVCMCSFLTLLAAW